MRRRQLLQGAATAILAGSAQDAPGRSWPRLVVPDNFPRPRSPSTRGEPMLVSYLYTSISRSGIRSGKAPL